MKIEVDLTGILEEDGSVCESVREQVVKVVSAAVEERLRQKIENRIGSLIDKSLMKELDSIAKKLIDYKFTPVDSWGEKGKTSTVREAMMLKIKEECVFKNWNGYSSDQNKFTQLFQRVFDSNIKRACEKIFVEVDARFTEECIRQAERRIKKRVGIN